MFSNQQKEDENTDIFISRCRALFSKLPVEHKITEICQIDMVYGLLHYLNLTTLFTPSNEPTPYAEHTINLTSDISISVPPYRMSEPNKKLLQDELNKLLSDGVIEECESPYSAPVVLVPKPDGSIRLCVNYQGLNEVTISDKYPLPRIDDLLHTAKQTTYMTTLDLKSGYHQVSVRESDRDKTAFICPFGIFRFRRMPVGMKNAPSTFQRLIDRFRAGLQDLTILAYLDDLILLSRSFQEHLADLRKVFDRLKVRKKAFRKKGI